MQRMSGGKKLCLAHLRGGNLRQNHPRPCGDPSSEDYKYNTYDWEGCIDDHYSSVPSNRFIYSAFCLKNRITMK